jgi:aspartyl-tRNA(Asn)/glutamyl-tRNA(Gln) amidotransferase subunit A
MALSGILYTSEAYGLWGEVIEADAEAMFGEIRERFRMGRDYAAADYVAAWTKIDAVRNTYEEASAAFDAVILPTAPILPPDKQRLIDDHDYYLTENLLALRNTRIGNLMGLCALTLPTGTASCGLSLMGKPGGEEALLRLGAAVEEALA